MATLLLPGTHLHPVDLALIAAYLIAITLFGLHFRERRTDAPRTLRSYFLAGNTIPWWAISLSVVSAETSTLTIISIPGVAFAGDLGFLQVVLGYLVGRVIVAFLFLPRYLAGDMLTAYQLIDQRFGAILHKVTAGLFLLTRAAAEGVRVFAVSIVVTIAIGTGDILSIAIISALTLLYTFEGGLAAVIWTDVVQMAIYVAGTVLALISLGHHIPGGWPAILHTAAAAGKLQTFHFGFNLTQNYTFWAGLLGGTFLTMASHGTDQLMVQRLLAARNLRQSQLALLSSGVVILMQFAFFLFIGIGLWVFYGMASPAGAPSIVQSHRAMGGISPDRLFPTFITQEMPTGVAGLLVAAILAAAMSNLSAALNSLSSTTVVDFYMRTRPLAPARERDLVSKASTALWALVLFAIALVALHNGGHGHVVEIGLSIASVAYGCLLGVFLLGTLTRTATQTGAILGMVTGFALNLWLWQGHFPVHLGALTIPHIAFTWYVLIGAAVTFAVGLLASLPKPKTLRPAAASPLLLLSLFFLSSPKGICCPPAQAQTPQQPQTPTQPRINPRTPNPDQLPAKPLKVQPLPPADFTQLTHLVDQAIAQHLLPGAVVVIGHGGDVVFHKAFGDRKLAGEPGPNGQPSPAEPMTEDTVFDIASLTKVIVTTTAIGLLHDEGRIEFDAPVERYLPAFNPTHDPTRSKVTVRLLLTHFSGEAPDVDLKDAWGLRKPDKEEGLRRALTTPLVGTPGQKFVYSDINFILLGAMVEKITSFPLDLYAKALIFDPLELEDTRYLPFVDACGAFENLGSAISWKSNATFTKAPDGTGTSLIRDYICSPAQWRPQTVIPNTAPTAHDDQGTPATNPDFDQLLRGTVHDPTARRMGGVAGHAGLFSTARDLSTFAQALLDQYSGRPSKFPLSRKTLVEMSVPQQPGHTPFQLGEHIRANAQALAQGQKPTTGDPALLDPNFPAIPDQPLRGLGWDIDTAFSKPRGRLPIGSFGHTGFTGTSLWLDPQSDTYILLLSNSVHPRGGKAISNLRGEVATAAAKALDLYPELPPTPPQPDHLEKPIATNTGEPPPSTTGPGPAATPVADLAQPSRPWRQSASLLYTSYTPPPRPHSVQTGIDVLEAQNFTPLTRLATPNHPLHLGLLTNQTGRDSQNRRTVDILAKNVPNAQLLRLFSPEHGIFGQQDTEHLNSETDPATGIHVTSLYGAHDADRRPTHAQLKDLDAVVIDLQDVGVRCYTYETVLGYFLEAAAAERTQYGHTLPIVVLDRPNPLGGTLVTGPVSDRGSESYINYMPLPFQHGLTFGELARYIDQQKNLHAPLEVVPMQGWQRNELFPDTNLPWIPPSPNLHTPRAALLYPATAMLEFTNLSVGRGSPLAFEVFGAPAPANGAPAWFNAKAVADDLNQQNLSGVFFEPISLPIAEDTNHYPGHGQTIPAVRILPNAPRFINGPELGMALLVTLHRLYPTQFQMARTSRMISNRQTTEALQSGATADAIKDLWAPALDRFRTERAPILLYPSTP